jgi:peptidylprolyl isomerase
MQGSNAQLKRGLGLGLVFAAATMLLAACSSGPAATIIDNTVPAPQAQVAPPVADTSGAFVTTGATSSAPMAVANAAPAGGDASNTLVMELKTGKVTIRLRPDLAPKHVERIKTLTKEGFYNGLSFHRVIAGFMAQTGDPKGDGTGGSQLPDVPAEFTPTAFERGTVGAARADSPNSANSQFFICFKHSPFLNGQYTVWGNVVDGMQHIDQIAKGEPPPNPDKIVKMYLASDAS